MRPLPIAPVNRYYVSLGDARSRNGNGYVGAASGFYERLVAGDPSWKMIALATDGATAATVRYVQLPRLLEINAAPSLITMTIGASELSRLAFGDSKAVCAELCKHGGAVLASLRVVSLRAEILLATLYDPMDGKEADLAEGVARYNETLRTLAAVHGAAVADVCPAFAGHGARAGDPLTADASPPNQELYLCAGADLSPIPNRYGATAFTSALWEAYEAG